MKIKKYILVLVAMAIVLGGCFSSKGNSTSGEVVEISANELLAKKENKENFAMVFTQTTCSHCITFLEMLEEYLPDHNVVIYEVVLDHEKDREAALQELESVFPEFKGTPDIYYIENGEIKSRFWNEYEQISESTFHKWVEQYNLISEE